MITRPITLKKTAIPTYHEVQPVDITPFNYTDVDYVMANIANITTFPADSIAPAAKSTRNKIRRMLGDDTIAVRENRAPMSFDIETTGVNKFETKKGVKKCVYSASYMYKWQFGIDDIIIHGRTWDQFISLMNAIRDNNSSGMEYMAFRCFIANLGFEFQFMAPRLIADGWDCAVFAREARNPITATFTKQGFTMVFQDALQISNCSLSKLAENYALPSKKKDGDLDYSKPRNSKTKLTDEEMEYCSFDCRVLNDFYEWIYVNYVDNGLPFPLTATGLVRHDVKHYFNKFEKVKTTKTVNGKTKTYTKYSTFRKSVLPHMFPDTYEDYLDLVTNCYSGGFTHANAALAGRVLHDVNGGDFTSSYPYTIMFQKFPMTPFISDNITDLDTIRTNNANGIATIFKVKFTNLRTTTTHSTISISKSYEYKNYASIDECQEALNAIVDNGRVVCADYMTLYITDLDLIENLDKFYEWDDATILMAKTSKYGYLPDYVRWACACFYSAKNKLKKAHMDKTTAYRIAKAFVNSIYGMMVQRLTTGEIAYNDGSWEKVVDAIEGADEHLNSEIEYISQIFDENGKVKLFLSPYWGVYVTAHARGNLFKILSQIGLDSIYCDTDSIYYQNPEKWQHICDEYNAAIYKGNLEGINEWNNTPGHEDMQLDIEHFKDLGEFDKLNKLGNYSRFKTLGAKRYLKEGPEFNDKTGEIEIHIESTIAGLPKSALIDRAEELGVDPFDLFQNGMEIPDCKKCHRYNDAPTTDTIIDEDGNVEDMTEFASVGIYDIDFTMKMGSKYCMVLETYAKTKERENFIETYKEVMSNEKKVH